MTILRARRITSYGATGILWACLLVYVVACSATNPAATPATIVAEASAIGTGLDAMLTQVTVVYPALIPHAMLTTIRADLADAKAAAAGLSANMPAASGAATVKTVLGDVNAVLDVIAAPPINGLIPAPYNMALAAAAILAPEMEAFVVASIPAAAASPLVASTRAKLRATAPQVTTPADALAVLRGYR